jgi:hypothetical protein
MEAAQKTAVQLPKFASVAEVFLMTLVRGRHV